MTIKELIEFLSILPPELPVAYPCCSEYCLLEKDDVVIK
jgi:hypothetical protein